MADRRQEALDYHASGRPGKIETKPTKPAGSQRDLALAYSPGVAAPCLEIAARPEDAFKYTAKGNLVAVVSNGTAVLGLGNIGALAGKPVMEGKGVLFKNFADIDVFDLEVGSENPDDVIKFCQLLEPTVGGINLEDIRAPDCFVIEERLRETLSIPVFHDDQHGTAIISGAALLNAVELTKRKLNRIKCVFSGAGASAVATAEHYVALGVKRENIILVDSKGVVHDGRDGMDPYRSRFKVKTDARTLEEAMVGADVFVGLSKGGLVSADMVKSMADRPIVFALANPDPEILPEDVKAACPDAIVATGRSDYPNQVNNVLGFPFIFRGALDVRARQINEEMKMAATRALAELAREDVPDVVRQAYGGEALTYGPDYIIPTPFDSRALLRVAPAVAQAAIDSDVSDASLDVDEYINELEARLGQARAIMRGLAVTAASDPQVVAFPEGTDERVLRAARALADDHVIKPLLLGRRDSVEERAAEVHVDLEDIRVVDPEESSHLEQYAEQLFANRQRKGLTLNDARYRVRDPLYHALMMAKNGHVDAVVAGQETYYPETIRPALETVGRQHVDGTICSVYMIVTSRELFFFADCAVNIDPSAAELSEIALATAAYVRSLGITPRVAMLSFSNFGSVRHPESRKMAEAVELLRAKDPDLESDGEMQADTAVVSGILKGRYPFSRLTKPANVLVFPDLDAANIAYKLLTRLSGAEAIGPILLGMAEPVHVLQRSSQVNDIMNMAVIAAVDAQGRPAQT